TATILSHFHPFDRGEACRSYRSFVAEGIGSTRSPWEDLIANVYLGSRGFIGRVEGLTKRNWSNEHSIAQQSSGGMGVASAVRCPASFTLCPVTQRSTSLYPGLPADRRQPTEGATLSSIS